MYSIYADNKLLYSPLLANDGYTVLSPKIKYGVNKAGSLSFILPPSNPLYDGISKLKSIITVYRDDTEIFRGRVLRSEKDFYRRKNIYCEGDLAFLVDAKIRPYEYSGSVSGYFNKLISEYNACVDANKRFTVGTVSVTDPNDYITRASSDYPTTWEEINNKLIKLLGGYVRTRKAGDARYIDYIESYGSISDQTIEFGKNLLDINEYISAEDVFTAIIPLGANQEDGAGNSLGRLTIASINNGLDYVENGDAIALFGRIEKTEIWDDVTLPSNLKRKGEERLAEGIKLAVSLKIKAYDLSRAGVNVGAIKVGDMVRIISLPHGIDRYVMCTEIELDLSNKGNSVYSFGQNYTTLTEKTIKNQNTMQAAVSEVSARLQQIKSTADQTADAVADVKGTVDEIPDNYVNVVTFSNYTASAGQQADSMALRLPEYIAGTQTATTGAWTGVSRDSALYDGKHIYYWLPYASNAAATLNLTLSNGSTTGPIPIYRYSTAVLTSQYVVYSIVSLTYVAAREAWYADGDIDTNTHDRTQHTNQIKAAAAITGGRLICGTSAGYQDIAAGVTFDVSYPLLYAGSSVAIGKTNANTYLTYPSVSLRNTMPGYTGTAYSMVYLVGTFTGTLFAVDTDVFTCTPPASADGKSYMPIGLLASAYAVYFNPQPRIYAYTDGAFRAM